MLTVSPNEGGPAGGGAAEVTPVRYVLSRGDLREVGCVKMTMPPGGTRTLVMHVAKVMSVLLVAACGAPSSHPSQPVSRPTPTSLAELASTYAIYVEPANTAYSKLAMALCFNGVTACVSASMSAAQPLFRTYLSALTTLNEKLPSFQALLPVTAQADLGQFRQAIATEISDLGNVVQDTDEPQFWSDERRWAPETFKTAAADNLVRADLGLPAGQ